MPKAADTRRRVLRELISTTTVRTEAELRDALRRRGIHITQATVSRDLAALGAARVRTAGGWRYMLRHEETSGAIRELALLEITNIAANESMIVVKTRVGHASGVAVFLDNSDVEGLLGTLAGNDTVLVIPDSHHHLQRLLAQLRRLVYGDEAARDARE